MVSDKIIIRILSDMIMVFSAVELIDSFGISKSRGLKYKLMTAAVILIPAIIFVEAKGSLLVFEYTLMFAAAFMILFSKVKLSYIYIALASEFITSILSSCLYSFFKGTVSSVYFKAATLLTIRTILLIIVLILGRSEKARRMHLIIKIIPKYIFILTALAVMFISLLAENNNLIAESSAKQTVNALLIASLTVSLIAIIFSLLISVVSKKQIADTNAMLTEMVDVQLRHYKRFEKLNDDIRSFRHDYINHIRSIAALLETGQIDDAKEYTGKLINASPAQNFSFQTGNNLADAILTDKNDFCGESAKIVFYGFIPDKIDNSDLCVILSNALDNAAEACTNCAECDGQSLIEVCAQERQGYFVLTVRNPTADQRTYSCIPDTGKPDALNHGFGLRNIESVVKKHDGQLSVKCESNVFELSLTFKL